MKAIAIVPAAGKGKRMGGIVSKPYLLIGGMPILSYTLEALSHHDEIFEIIVVTRKEEVDYCKKEVISKYNFTKVSAVVQGGEERQDSVYAGLKSIKGRFDIVVIHDGVRPFLSQRLLTDVITNASKFKAALAALPARDTLKRVDNEGCVSETVSRDSIWHTQTPQAFEYDLIVNVYEEAFKDNFYGTDDAGLVERCGHRVKIIMGSPQNIKITAPEDLTMAEAILELDRW